MKKAKLIGMLTAIVLSIIVILQNTQPVGIRFLFIKITMSNAIWLGLTLLIGILIGILVSVITSSSRKTIKK